MEELTKSVFEKEVGFYKEIIPLLNQNFEILHERPLRVPKYFYSVTKEKGQVIFLEDMRKKGFKMVDRKIGMDRNHTMLVMKELARLHAISVVLIIQKRKVEKNLFLDKTFSIFFDGTRPFCMKDDLPYIEVRSGVCAKLARSVYYQLVELGECIELSDGSVSVQIPLERKVLTLL